MSRTPLVPSDVHRLITASDPQCALGGVVYYTRAWLDAGANETRSAIWRVAPGSDPAPFTAGPKDRSPRLSRDGKRLAFVGDRGNGTQLFVLALDRGGEARAIGPSYDAIGSLEWSPLGDTLAYTAKTALDPSSARVAVDEVSCARHIRGLPFKSDDDGLLDGRRKHLFVLEAEGGEPLGLTSGDFDADAPAWSPDGSQVAYASREGERETSFLSNIFVVPRGGGVARKLTGSQGPLGVPSFSPDGSKVAFVGHLHGDDAGGRFDEELLLVDAGGGRIRSLSASLERAVGDHVICDTRNLAGSGVPVWSADGDTIFMQLSDAGTCGVRAFSPSGESRAVLGGQRDISAFSLASDGTIAFVYSDPLVPSDLALLRTDGSELRLTTQNAWLDERTVRMPRHVAARAGDGTALDGWVLDASAAPGRPLVLQVHGGPHAAYGYAFFFEFQMLASHGISVAYGNPRGSQSYGTAFANAITGDWGGIDAADVLSILDAVLASGDYDTSRIAVAGGSYGGFMTTWLLGHSKRFVCGISMRSVNDFVSEVGASDLGWFLEVEVGGSWMDGQRQLFERSPMRAAQSIEAPLLILHSERDFRCPIDQGEQLFTLLRRLDKAVEFVRFTGDGHNLGRSGNPRNRVVRLRAIAQWLGRHLRPGGWTPAADAAGALFEPLETENPTPAKPEPQLSS